MDIQKLLFVTQFEELRFDALQSLLNLKEAALNHVVFLSVIERDKVAMRRGSGYQKEEEIRLREKANIRFIDWAENLFEQGMEVGVYISVGTLVQQVVEAVEKERVDLSVIASPKKGKLEKLFTGSDIGEIISRTGVPLLVYKNISPDGKITDQPFTRPLLATDWSEQSLQAVEYLKRLGSVIEQIDVIHVAHEKSLIGSSAMAIQKTRKETRGKLEDICEVFEAEGIFAKPHVYIGDAIQEVEKAARECRSTMVVTGASGSGSWKKRLKKSTAVALAETSTFHILLIPPQKV